MKRWLSSLCSVLCVAGAALAEPETLPAVPDTAEGVVEAPAPVTVDALSNVPYAALGMLQESTGGLGAEVWQGLDAAQLHILLERLPTEYRSAAMRGLASRILLTSGARLKGENAAQELVLRARLKQLLAMNDYEAVLDILSQLPAAYETAALQHLAVDALLAADRLEEACAIVAKVQASAEAGEFSRHHLLCLAVQGKDAELQVALGLLAEKQLSPPDYFQALLQATLAHSGTAAAATPPAPDAIPGLSLVDCLAYQKSGLEPPFASLVPHFPRMSPLELDCAARRTALPPLAKGFAIERLAAVGQQEAQHLAESYLVLAAEPETDQPSLAGLRERAALFKTFMEGDDKQALDALPQMIARQPDLSVTLALASRWNDRLALMLQSLPPAELEKHLLLLGAFLVPSEPALLAERLPATPPYSMLVWMADATRRLNATDPAQRAANPEITLPVSGPMAEPWRIKLHVIAGFLGDTVETSFPVGAPSAEAARLAAAAQQGRVGETALRALYLTGTERPGKLPPADLKAVLGGLQAVGLEAEARQLAAETLADVALEVASATPL